MEWLYPLILLVSVGLGLLFVRLLKGRMLNFGIKGIDINKEEKPNIPESGGMLILPGIWILSILLVWLQVINPITYVFLFTITCFAAIGFFDDGFRLFKEEKGWARYVANRGIILFLFTLPFTYLVTPSLIEGQSFEFYFFVLLGGALILLTSSLTNSFAGLNGWEVGSSAIILVGLTVMASYSQVYTSTLITLCLIMLGAVVALFYFNKFPARVFPGDSGTLLIGSFIGCTILFIDRWYLALALFAPHIYDIALKLHTNRKDMSQKKEKPYVLKEGKLVVPESNKLDFAKLLIKKVGPKSEKKLVKTIHLVVIQNTLLWTLLYILLELI